MGLSFIVSVSNNKDYTSAQPFFHVLMNNNKKLLMGDRIPCVVTCIQGGRFDSYRTYLRNYNNELIPYGELLVDYYRELSPNNYSATIYLDDSINIKNLEETNTFNSPSWRYVLFVPQVLENIIYINTGIEIIVNNADNLFKPYIEEKSINYFDDTYTVKLKNINNDVICKRLKVEAQDLISKSTSITNFLYSNNYGRLVENQFEISMYIPASYQTFVDGGFFIRLKFIDFFNYERYTIESLVQFNNGLILSPKATLRVFKYNDKDLIAKIKVLLYNDNDLIAKIKICYSNSKDVLLAIGESRQVYKSIDSGMSWEKISEIPELTDAKLYYANNFVIALSKYSYDNYKYAYSYDGGYTWFIINHNLCSFNNICYNGKVWVAGGYRNNNSQYTLLYSDDGLNWKPVNAYFKTQINYVWTSVLLEKHDFDCTCVYWTGKHWIIGITSNNYKYHFYALLTNSMELYLENYIGWQYICNACAYSYRNNKLYMVGKSTSRIIFKGKYTNNVLEIDLGNYSSGQSNFGNKSIDDIKFVDDKFFVIGDGYNYGHVSVFDDTNTVGLYIMHYQLYGNVNCLECSNNRVYVGFSGKNTLGIISLEDKKWTIISAIDDKINSIILISETPRELSAKINVCNFDYATLFSKIHIFQTLLIGLFARILIGKNDVFDLFAKIIVKIRVIISLEASIFIKVYSQIDILSNISVIVNYQVLSAIIETNKVFKFKVKTILASGISRKLYKSIDEGQIWTTNNVLIPVGNPKLAFNHDIVIAVGNDIGYGTIVYSENCGERWNKTNNISCNFVKVAWNEKVWIGVGSYSELHNYIICYSYDGKYWYPNIAKDTILREASDVIWDGNQWIVIGSQSIPNRQIALSNNGITWRLNENPAMYFDNKAYCIAVNDVKYICGGGYLNNNNNSTLIESLRSTSANNWYKSTSIFGTNGCVKSIAWNGSSWCAVGTGNNTIISFSNDGVIWTNYSGDIKGNKFEECNSIIWNGSKWYVCGKGKNTIASTYNNIDWTEHGQIDSEICSIYSFPMPKIYPPFVFQHYLDASIVVCKSLTFNLNSKIRIIQKLEILFACKICVNIPKDLNSTIRVVYYDDSNLTVKVRVVYPYSKNINSVIDVFDYTGKTLLTKINVLRQLDFDLSSSIINLRYLENEINGKIYLLVESNEELKCSINIFSYENIAVKILVVKQSLIVLKCKIKKISTRHIAGRYRTNGQSIIYF